MTNDCKHFNAGWCYKEDTVYTNGCVGYEQCEYRWPESEERIDVIGSNGNTGTHYLDVKRQMLEQPTDKEVLEWLLNDQKTIDFYQTSDGKYWFCCAMKVNGDYRVVTECSEIGYLDAVKMGMKDFNS